MKADLYIRVSTDEQADKGYSQRDQEDRLIKYCDNHKIEIRNIIFEDHSAKNFNRPEWNKIMVNLRNRKKNVDFLLFTKWDRFSRNAGDAYQMISTLRNLEVEPQAIEQPLDLSVPENKLMLAFYLAAPEVENDRRALNVLLGMRKARKEGRWMGPAPIGYANKVTEDGKKYISPKQPQAGIMKWAFETLNEDHLNVEQVWKIAVKKGINCCKARFWNLLRNPVYCGRMFMSGYKEEGDTHVLGNHESIITESLFYEVQDYLDGKKKKYRTKVGAHDELQLRGYLLCPRCNKVLTGSASKGRNGKYYYYHCHSKCGARFNAKEANDKFLAELDKFTIKPGMAELYTTVLDAEYKVQSRHLRNDVVKIKADLEKANNELATARKLLLSGDIEPADYRSIKSETDNTINRLESKLIEVSKDQTVQISNHLKQGMEALLRLKTLFVHADNKEKRDIVGSIYPEKLTFDGDNYRTARLNEAVALIYTLGAGFSENKNGQTDEKIDLSKFVNRPGFEPR